MSVLLIQATPIVTLLALALSLELVWRSDLDMLGKR
jgi:hypothetical protein